MTIAMKIAETTNGLPFNKKEKLVFADQIKANIDGVIAKGKSSSSGMPNWILVLGSEKRRQYVMRSANIGEKWKAANKMSRAMPEYLPLAVQRSQA
jgi:hypothetical protein